LLKGTVLFIDIVLLVKCGFVVVREVQADIGLGVTSMEKLGVLRSTTCGGGGGDLSIASSAVIFSVLMTILGGLSLSLVVVLSVEESLLLDTDEEEDDDNFEELPLAFEDDEVDDAVTSSLVGLAVIVSVDNTTSSSSSLSLLLSSLCCFSFRRLSSACRSNLACIFRRFSSVESSSDDEALIVGRVLWCIYALSLGIYLYSTHMLCCLIVVLRAIRTTQFFFEMDRAPTLNCHSWIGSFLE